MFNIFLIISLLIICKCNNIFYSNISNFQWPYSKYINNLNFYKDIKIKFETKSSRTYGNPGDSFILYNDIYDSSFNSNYSIYKDNNIILPGVDYYINYTTDNKILQYKKQNTALFKAYMNNSYKLGCDNHLSDFQHENLVLVNGYNNIKKIDSFNNFNFALINDSMKYINFNDKGIIRYIDFDINRKLINFWLIKNSVYPSIILQSYDNKLFLYNLSNSVEYYSTIDLTYYILNNDVIEKVDIKNEFMYIGAYSGFYVYNSTNFGKSWNL